MLRLVLCFSAALTLQATPTVFTKWTAVMGSVAPDKSTHHIDDRSWRVDAPAGSHAEISSEPIHLTIAKTYEIDAYVLTKGLTVKDLDRSPIASGAALTMDSMPFDVHSASVANDHDWVRLTLRFVATRSEDRILLIAGRGGALQGTAWFEHVTLTEVPQGEDWPVSDAVRTFGPAYRYPAAGWIYLHIEGKPYDRGYQHGYLMAREIPEYLARCAIELTGKVDNQSWSSFRTAADALFLRGFDQEILDEMRGIVDGANAGGAKFLGRKLDLVDLVLANTTVEMGELAEAMPVTANGRESTRFDLPPYAGHHDSPTEHCSAFAATGSATRDGKMVIGHVTWWPQNLAEQTNVMLDIKPETGHHLLMQSYPGGIESGTDWYQNDAGVVLTETTIRQTPFNAQGTPVAFRARRAIQYGGNIDEVVKELSAGNNGLYTNEWIIGDAKNNEIAMYELGTTHTKLWRSSKNEWFGDTPGFYWGDNNEKDLSIGLEYAPDPHAKPEYLPYVPRIRDLAWTDRYSNQRGHIDEQFAFSAYDSAPLTSSSTMDAKIVTAEMANHMMVWAEFGRPNESVWPANQSNHGLYPGGYQLISARPSESLQSIVAANERTRLKPENSNSKAPDSKPISFADQSGKLWKGWLLPASREDTWFVAGSAAYEEVLEAPDVEKRMLEEKIRYRGLKLAPETPQTRFLIQQSAGVLFLDGLRHKVGDDAFFKLMSSYFDGNTTKTVTAQSFLDAAGVKYTPPDPGDGPAYLPTSLGRNPAVIVYGTAREACANRYVAEQLQSRLREYAQRDFPIYKDFEVNDTLLAHSDVIFVGRPETNSALQSWSKEIGLDYTQGVFKVDGQTYASERDSLVLAAKNPLDSAHMVLVCAGNSPLETARACDYHAEMATTVLEDGKERF